MITLRDDRLEHVDRSGRREPWVPWSDITCAGCIDVALANGFADEAPGCIDELLHLLRAAQFMSGAKAPSGDDAVSVMAHESDDRLSVVTTFGGVARCIATAPEVWHAAVVTACAPQWAAKVLEAGIEAPGPGPLSGGAVADAEADFAVRSQIAREFAALAAGAGDEVVFDDDSDVDSGDPAEVEP